METPEIWYHGTNREIQKPTLRDLQRFAFAGEGLQRYGLGIYLTDTLSVAEHYAKLDPQGKPTIHQARVSTLAKLVHWQSEADDNVYKRIAQSSLPDDEKQQLVEDKETYQEGMQIRSLYGTIAAILDGLNFRYDKKPAIKTSRFFVQELEIDGVTCEDENHGGINLCLYDPQHLYTWEKQ